MKFWVHLALTLIVASAFIARDGVISAAEALAMMIAVVASTLPNLDTPGSLLVRLGAWLRGKRAAVDQGTQPHGGPLHSLIAAPLVALVVAGLISGLIQLVVSLQGGAAADRLPDPLLTLSWIYQIVTLGYVAHLIHDLVLPDGLPLLWPLRDVRVRLWPRPFLLTGDARPSSAPAEADTELEAAGALEEDLDAEAPFEPEPVATQVVVVPGQPRGLFWRPPPQHTPSQVTRGAGSTWAGAPAASRPQASSLVSVGPATTDAGGESPTSITVAPEAPRVEPLPAPPIARAPEIPRLDLTPDGVRIVPPST
ncbi:MAG TPA: metal-dependent hydrolase [Chloroflexota bacterium]|nr:metal-dependent hydrolase [Chloroflexota bacterium]